MDFYRPIIALWICAGIVWLLAAANRPKSVARVEPHRSRLMELVIMVPAFLLIFYNSLRTGPLDRHFDPDTQPVWIAGFLVTMLGVAFAIWARLIIGANWSAMVTVRCDHELIRRGPYAIVRHPIYAGFLLGLLGTAIAFGQWRDLLGFALAFIGWRYKSLIEERFMTEQFGEQYVRYQREVKALIPFVY